MHALSTLTHWPLDDMAVILNIKLSNSLYRICIVWNWSQVNATEQMSIFVQVIAWRCQSTSHYLGQCSPRYMSSCGTNRLQVNLYWPFVRGIHQWWVNVERVSTSWKCIRDWSYKRHTIPSPNGRAMVCLCKNFEENWLHQQHRIVFICSCHYIMT